MPADSTRPEESLYDLVRAHSNGEITIRQIASLKGLSSEQAYEVVTAVYHHYDFGDGDTGPTTLTPERSDDGKVPYPEGVSDGWPDNDEELPLRADRTDELKQPYHEK